MLQIIVGSYERLLYGFSVTLESAEGRPSAAAFKPIYIYSPHIGCIKALAVSSNGRRLASGSTDEQIKLYDLKRRTEIGTLMEHQGSITALEFHGAYLLSASEDGSICLWRSKDWECLKTLRGHSGAINAIAVHPTGKLALSVGGDRTLRMWDLMRARSGYITKLQSEGEIVVWNNSGSLYAISFRENAIVEKIENDNKPLKIKSPSRIVSMKFYEELLVLGCEDKTIRFFNAETGEQVKSHAGFTSRIRGLSFIQLAGDNFMVCAMSDGVIQIFLVERAKDDGAISLHMLGEHNAKSRITCLAISIISEHDSEIETAEAKEA